MKSTGPALLLLCGDCVAHPGHGVALAHIHASDWIQLIAVACAVVAASVAARRRK